MLNRAGLIDVSQSSPVAIVADDSQNVQFLQINDAYLKSLQSIGTKNVTDSNLFLRSRNFPMHQKFRHFADKAQKSGQPETMTYVDNGQYMQVPLKTVAQAGQRCIHQAELYNISLDEAARDKQSRRFDNLLRNILLTYEGIWYLDMERRVLEIIEPLTSDQQVGETNPDIDGTFRHFAEYFVHPKDRERFLHFTDWDQFYQQAAASENGMITEPFRLLRSNGNFDWFMIIGMVLPKSPSQDILFFITKPPFDDPKKLRPLLWEMLRSYGITAEDLASDTANMSHALWQTFLQHSREKVIWKDRSHRIGGASQAFVEWLGIPEKELLGKTTQELGFCVDCQVDDETDEKAMCTGQAVSGCLLHFVVKHLPHLVRADKFPIYQNDKMTGVVLCFHDVEKIQDPLLKEIHAAVTDEETGFLNYRGMVMAGLRYADTYRLHGDDYTAALIDVPEFDAIGLTYGPKFRQHLRQKITAILKEYLPQSLTISHIGSSCFLLFQKAAHMAQLQQALIQISNAIHAIQQVDGFPCTLYMHYAIVQGAEARSLDSLLQLLIKRMHESEEAKYGQALYTSDRFIFNREAFDDDELGVVVSDLETYELLYCNPTMRKRSGIPLDAPLEGQKCYEMMAGLSAPCTDCCQPRLSRSRFTSRIFHNPVAGMDFLLRDILIPWHGKNCHFCTCLNLDEYLTKDMRFNKMLFFKTSVNDAIRLGMYETDPVHGIHQMMSRIGRQLETDRIILAEEKGDNVAFTYTWEADGILPFGEDFQPISRVELRHVFDHFSQGNSFTISDMAAYWQEHPNLAPHIPGIQRLALARLMLDGQPYGFITVINPSPEKLHQAEELLTALTRFFTILLRNRDMMQRLDRLSKSDQLTGLLNRRGFKDRLASLPEGQHFAFIFGDLNELKETNDTLGHEAGDQLLCVAAQIFLHVGHEGFIFRMGGDEFLMIEEIQQPQEAQALLKKLEEHFQAGHISIALGYTTAETPIEDIDAILTQADTLMYCQKLQQHRVNPDT